MTDRRTHGQDSDPGGLPEPVRLLRRHYEGVLLFDQHPAPVRFVLDGATGQVVFQVEPVALEASHFVLFVPEERDDALALLIEPRPADPRAADAEPCDRWTIYHAQPSARPGRTRFAAASIQSAKLDGNVYDAGDIPTVNPLRADELSLLRAANSDRAALARACSRLAAVTAADPVAVGIDPGGIDLRARFGVLRLEFPSPAPNMPLARAALASLLAP